MLVWFWGFFVVVCFLAAVIFQIFPGFPDFFARQQILFQWAATWTNKTEFDIVCIITELERKASVLKQPTYTWLQIPNFFPTPSLLLLPSPNTHSSESLLLDATVPAVNGFLSPLAAGLFRTPINEK